MCGLIFCSCLLQTILYHHSLNQVRPKPAGCGLLQKQSYPVLELFYRTALLSLAQVLDALHDQNYPQQKCRAHQGVMPSKEETEHTVLPHWHRKL